MTVTTTPEGDLRPNRYAGACVQCNAPVAAGAGWLVGKVRGQWVITHRADECVKRNPNQDYYESLLTEAGGDIALAVCYLARDAEGWDGEDLARLSSIIDMKKVLGFDYQDEVDERRRVEDDYRALGWI